MSKIKSTLSKTQVKSPPQKSECPICTENIATLIECPECLKKVCKTCSGKYLCDIINEPNCMYCKHSFNRDFLIQNLGSSWYDTKYKNTRKDVLYDREKAQFQATMEFAQKYKNVQIYETRINELNAEYQKKLKEFYDFKKIYVRETRRLEKEIENINRGIVDVHPIPDDAIDSGGLSNNKTKTLAKLYTKCPVDKCSGMVNDENKCITCNIEICPTCFEIIQDEHAHTCDPNTLETMKLLKKDTKNCPGCSTPIHKIEGCYQMWCTNCHITFHYRTLEVLNEKIHNPHYVDWLKNNSNIGGVGGGDCQEIGYYSFSPFKKSDPVLYKSCCNILSHVNHVEAVYLGHARRQLQSYTNEDTKRLQRAQFMVGIIDEKKYKMLLFKSYKQVQRWSDVIDLNNMYTNTLKSILSNAVVTRKLDLLQKETTTLTKYVQRELDKINKLYGNYSQFQLKLSVNQISGEINLMT